MGERRKRREREKRVKRERERERERRETRGREREEREREGVYEEKQLLERNVPVVAAIQMYRLTADTVNVTLQSTGANYLCATLIANQYHPSRWFLHVA